MSAWINYNPIINAVADEQGVEVGSSAWTSGGMMAYSGQTGGHPSYGWNHKAKLNQDWVRAVIANYGHRRCYYASADGKPLMIQGQYLIGGRPFGWTPEDGIDSPKGQAMYLTSKGIVAVSGPDVQHFQIGPLLAVADSHGFTVKAQGKTWPAEMLAGFLVRMLMTCSAGQVLGSKGFLWGDRGVSLIVGNAVAATKRGLMNQEDMVLIFDWFKNHCLPFYEKAPGHHINNKDNGLPAPNLQTYNGIFWLMPAFYELSKIAPSGVKERVDAILKRFAQWTVDIDAIRPEYNLDVFAVSATEEIQKGDNGKPFDSLAGKLTKEQIGGGPGGTDWSLWNFRAAMIAQKILGAPADPLVDKLKAIWLPKASNINNRVWIVDADGEYL